MNRRKRRMGDKEARWMVKADTSEYQHKEVLKRVNMVFNP
jgi:hypothetical protein